jgi:hypothetical protein
MSSTVQRYDPKAARILAAFGFAAAIHLLALLLILTAHRIVSSPSTPVIDLQLQSRTVAPTPRSVSARRPSERKPSVPTSVAPLVPPAEPTIPNARSASAPSPPSPLPVPAPAPNLGAVLRGALGCDLNADGLSPAERQACADRLAQGRSTDPGAALPTVSPKARAAFDAGARRDDWIHQPFLAQKPKNGCRPMVVQKEVFAPGGFPGGLPGGVLHHPDWTTSLVCGKTF